ncbi:unnamed protein product [Calypogeia fissa]
MATSMSTLSLGFAAVTIPCPRRSGGAAATSSSSTNSPAARCNSARVVPALKFSLPPSRHRNSVVRRGRPSKSTGADSNNYLPLEIMDPQTGEYKNVTLSEEDDEYGVDFEGESGNEETDPEVLRQFARTIGLDDRDLEDSMFNKMRNPSSDMIVKQLEEGIGDAEDLLNAMYGDTPEYRELFIKIESLIRKGDVSSAHDIVEGNYEALLEQLNEGVFGVEQVAMMDILAFLFLRLENEDAAEQLCGQARELLDQLPDTDEMVDNILEHIATMYMKLKRPREALPLFERSLSIKKASKDEVPSIVRTMIALATAYSEMDQSKKSIQMYRDILALAEKSLGSDNEDLAAPLMHLGSSLLDDGRVVEAEMIIERAVKLTEHAYGGKDGRYGVALCVLAQIKCAKGEFEEALLYFRRGLQVIESSKDFKQSDDSLDTIRMDVAALLTVLGREKEAQEVLRQTMVKDKQYYAYYACQQVEYLEKQAELCAEAGELEKAEKALRHCLELLNSTVGPESTQVSVVLQLLSTLLHAQPDRQSEAEPLARQSVRLREQIFGTDHIAVGEAYSHLASILHQRGQDAEAADLMYKVLAIQEREVGIDCPVIEETLEVLNMLLVNLGRHRETIQIVQRLERMRSETSFSV